MALLVYCATPSRLSNKTKEISNYIAEQGHGPLHPFQAMPYKLFEGGKVGRLKSMEFCMRLVGICDQFRLFGVSKGTLQEIVEAQRLNKEIKLELSWDPEWKEFYAKLGKRYGNPLDKYIK